MIKDALHRCTTKKTMFSNNHNLAPNSWGLMDFKVCNYPSSNSNMEHLELLNQQLLTFQLLIFAQMKHGRGTYACERLA
jgi:hypothetical protein